MFCSIQQIGHAFVVCIHTENQVGFYPFVLCEISVLTEPALGHLRYHLTDVPPQPNSSPDAVFDSDRPRKGGLKVQKVGCEARFCLIE